jgi:hypothetical protein
MPSDATRYRLAGPCREHDKVFFIRQDADGMLLFATEDSIRSATLFSKSEAIARCQRFRDGVWDCRIVNGAGEVLFEEESRPVVIGNGEDSRPSLFYIGDGHSDGHGDGLGYIVRPAIRPDIGKCYCCRAIDIPALAGREIESVFDKDPEQAVLKFLLICRQAGIDLATLPSRRPDLDSIEDAELRKIIRNIQNQTSRAPANIRPGDR